MLAPAGQREAAEVELEQPLGHVGELGPGGRPAGRREAWQGRGHRFLVDGPGQQVGVVGRLVEQQGPAGVRWATLTDGDGNGIRVEGEPTFDLTARPWTSEHLDAARHPTDLHPGDRVWVNLDLAQQGIGSASCGPGGLPAYRLDPAPASFTVRLYPAPAEPSRR
jgi:beta-galactosidase